LRRSQGSPYQYEEKEQAEEEELKPMSFWDFKSLRLLKIAPVYIFGQEIMNIELAPEDDAASRKLERDLSGSLLSDLEEYTSCAAVLYFRMNT